MRFLLLVVRKEQLFVFEFCAHFFQAFCDEIILIDNTSFILIDNAPCAERVARNNGKYQPADLFKSCSLPPWGHLYQAAFHRKEPADYFIEDCLIEVDGLKEILESVVLYVIN